MKQLLHYWPSFIVLCVILYATWLPHPLPETSIPAIPHIDKLIHAIMMGGFVGALMFDYYRGCPSRRPLTLRITLAFTASVMAFCVVDEVVQGILPIGRPSDPIDLLADWFGCLVALLTAPPAIRAVVKRK